VDRRENENVLQSIHRPPLSFPSINKSLCDGLSNLISAMLAIFAKVDALTAMSNFIRIGDNGIVQNNVQVCN
jgi:hypothetical protein